eukprot:1196669-Amphidinium_carterae.1
MLGSNAMHLCGDDHNPSKQLVNSSFPFCVYSGVASTHISGPMCSPKEYESFDVGGSKFHQSSAR